MIFFISLTLVWIKSEPLLEDRRRRSASAATGRIWCGAVASQILLPIRFASQDKKREIREKIRHTVKVWRSLRRKAGIKWANRVLEI